MKYCIPYTFKQWRKIMKHIVALLIKYTAITAVLLIMLSIFQGISIPKVLLISLFLTGTAYLIGDLFILPKYGNGIATMADFGLSFFGIWLLTSLFTNLDATHNIGFTSFLAALIIGGIEVFFHIYMQKLVLRNDNELREHNHIHHDKYAMEISDEYMDSSTINKSKLKDTSKK
ncbi:YndM family protein [Bacillus cereus]